MLTVEYIAQDGLVLDRFEMANEMTLSQAACTICPDTGGKFPVPTIAIVGSRPAVRKMGDWDCPLSDTMVQFRQLAMGGGNGGSDPLRIVLQIAVIIAAAVTTYFTAGALGPVWAGVLGSMVGLGGSLLVGALMPTNMPSGQRAAMNAEQASPTYSINASGNQVRLYQTEPELFGRMKIVPDFVANTWTEFVNNDQIGYFVYAIGRGTYEIESLQFGETVFWRDGLLVDDSGYEIIDLEIVEPGNAVTIFPDNVITSDEVSGQTLFQPTNSEYNGYVGPYTTNPPGTLTNKISFDFVFQQGLGQYLDTGQLFFWAAHWKIEYRKVDDYDNPLTQWAVLENCSMTHATLTPIRITKNYNVPEGRYQVRVIRTSYDPNIGQYIDTLNWTALRATLPGTYVYPITCVAFSVRANNALTQNASRQFSAIATRKLPLYDRSTKTWSEPVPTRSWAAAISHVCKCEWGGELTDADIDLDTLWAIDERLQAKNWFYDSYIDGPYLVWKLICEICQAQCVIPRLVGPVLSFVEDAPNRTPSFALTPRNIVRGTFLLNYVTWSDGTPDDVTVEYLDEEYGFQQRDVTAVLPESESKEPSSLDILGITNRNHAHKVAIRYAAHNRWQRINVECQVEALGRIINQGDICTVSHPRFRNTCAGAVDWWNEASLLVCLKLDYQWPEQDKTNLYYIENQPKSEYPKTLESLVNYGVKTSQQNVIELESENGLYTDLDVSGKSKQAVQDAQWYIAFTRQDGSIWGPCKIASISDNKITLDSSDYSTLLLQGQGNPFEWMTAGRDRLPTTWVLYSARTYQRLMVVDSVTAQDDLHYSLKLLNYDSRIYDYDNLPVPIWQGRGQLPDTAILKRPEYLRGIIELPTIVQVCWLAVPGAMWYEVQYSQDGSEWSSLGRMTDCQTFITVDPGPLYVRVKAGNNDRMSTWATWQGDTLNPLPDVPNPVLNGKYEGGSADISWDPIANAESYVITLCTSDGIPFYTTIQSESEFELTPEIQTGGPYRDLSVYVKARNQTGDSDNGSLALSDPPPPAPTSIDVHPYIKDKFEISSVVAAKSGTGYVVQVSMSQTGEFELSPLNQQYEFDSLPYVFYWPLTIAYLRVAVKDAFYDVAHDISMLNWSNTIEIVNVLD